MFRPEDPVSVGQLTLATLSVENQNLESKGKIFWIYLNYSINFHKITIAEENENENDFNKESYDSSSSLSDSSLYNLYKKSGGKLAKQDYLFEIRSRRAFLFNKLSQLMPTNIVQPKENLSDFILT